MVVAEHRGYPQVDDGPGGSDAEPSSVEDMTTPMVELERQVQRNSNDIHAIYDLLTDVNKWQKAANLRFDGLDHSIAGLDRRLGAVEGRLDGIDGRLDGLDGRLGTVEGLLHEVVGILRSR
ncbi:chromosome segregation ATPase [Kineosphaera limosa]|uniref:Uncharacterized protein n=1 Tax=Kineosphaera limosa NBRC 100340 TaxID=1184609 RepID=K6VES7_9MICO|nr:hypothetical protein [Kineosphaera limosa]NYD99345.1 chromosome segregation ATPase [Kineosphaera limosa]GAB94698.1 hypothetical protein KILIM_010_00290 [Kineosphaera limosa NBRC 100340]